jgi:hypothetical protein
VRICVQTDLLEKFGVNLPDGADSFNDASSYEIHGTKSFTLNNLFYQVLNEYSAFVT